MQDIGKMLEGREEEAFVFRAEDRYIVIREITDGYDYSIKDMDCNEIDGGIYDDHDASIAEALSVVVDDILAMPDFNTGKGKIRESSILEEIDYNDFSESAVARF